tara:strand:+ start:205477 stop:205764 length:288 start_codon:yes stop_codon:yes gene_type:complete
MKTIIKSGSHRKSFTQTTAKLIERSEKTQREICEDIGYPHPNIITMFKNGETKVPLNKVPALAQALEIKPDKLMRLALQEYYPDAYQAILSAIEK